MSINSQDNRYEALLKLVKENYEAYLYDCDGTLADNMENHKETYVRVAADGNVHIDAGIIDELAGYPIPAVVEEINKRYKSSFDPYEFERQKSDLFYSEFIPKTKPIQFVVDHLKANAGKAKIGVVSGSSQRMVQKTLKVLGIDQLVDVVICAGDTEKGKPYPDPFLAAAKELSVKPERCLVFEDGDAGVKAAEAAGMHWIRIDKV